jgi:hypothetical protein
MIVIVHWGGKPAQQLGLNELQWSDCISTAVPDYGCKLRLAKTIMAES